MYNDSSYYDSYWYLPININEFHTVGVVEYSLVAIPTIEMMWL